MNKPMKAKIKKTVLYGLLFMASKWTIIAILYTSGFWSYWFLMLFPIADTIAAITAIIYLRNNFRKYFKDVLKENYPETFQGIIDDIEKMNDGLAQPLQFALKSNNPMDKRLPFSGYFLAMIQVLEKKEESYDRIKELCLEVAHAYVKPKNRIHKWIKLITPKLIKLPFSSFWLGQMENKIKYRANENGFVGHILTDKTETLGFGYGIDILECGICKLFKNNQAEKYSTILCEVDKLTASMVGLELVRGGTIAQGAHLCDFRFRQI
jgi:hypothetical protein